MQQQQKKVQIKVESSQKFEGIKRTDNTAAQMTLEKISFGVFFFSQTHVCFALISKSVRIHLICRRTATRKERPEFFFFVMQLLKIAEVNEYNT